jgi:hypothetical protein
MDVTGASSAVGEDRVVLVGRRWTDAGPSDWSVWGRDYDAAVEVVSERAGGYKPGVGFEVIEVTVHRRTVIVSDVKVTEMTARGEERS